MIPDHVATFAVALAVLWVLMRWGAAMLVFYAVLVSR